MRVALPVLVLALVAAGCGSASVDSAEDFEGPERAVAQTIEDLEEAGTDDDAKRICDELFADSLLQRLRRQQTNCRTAVSDGLDDADDNDLEVENIRIRGAAAQARVKSGDDDDEKIDVMRLARDGRRWKIESLGGGS